MKPDKELDYLLGIINGAMIRNVDPLRNFLTREIRDLTSEEAAGVTTTALALGEIVLRKSHSSPEVLHRNLRAEIVHTLNASFAAEGRRTSGKAR